MGTLGLIGTSNTIHHTMADHEHAGDDRTSAAAKKKFETVFQHANDAIFIVDVKNDDIVDCNPAAVDLVEYSREELMSMSASDLHPHNLQRFLDFTDTVFEQGRDGPTTSPATARAATSSPRRCPRPSSNSTGGHTS